MGSDSGYFEAYINQQAWRPSADERSTIQQISQVCQAQHGGQVHRAGSIAKGTAILGSDIDLCLVTNEPISKPSRKALRAALARRLQREVSVRSHVIRVSRTRSQVKVDLAFASATFGGRPLPDTTPFQRTERQLAVRAFKLWTRSNALPSLPGWTCEAMVIGLDRQKSRRQPLALFKHLMTWLAKRATPGNVEAILRPCAHPRWNEQWSGRLPGRLQALQNHARHLLRRDTGGWQRPADVQRWLSP